MKCFEISFFINTVNVVRMASTPDIFMVQPASTVFNNAVAQNKTKENYKFACSKFIEKVFCEKGWELPSKRPSHMDDESEPNYSNSFYGIICLLILASSAISTTLIPVHNVITSPEYWYEMIFSSSSTAFFLSCGGTIAVEAVLNPFKKRIIPVILDLCITWKIVELFWVCFAHFLWSEILGYFEPLPYRGTIICLLCNPVIFIRRWKLIPLQKRLGPTFRSKYKAFLGWAAWTYLVFLQIGRILSWMKNASTDIQWMIALTLPITKIINDYVLDKFITRAALDENVLEAKLMASIANNLAYSIGFAIAFTNATQMTEFLLLVFNGLLWTQCKHLREHWMHYLEV